MEALSDPLKDRVISQVKPPPQKPLKSELLFPENLKGFFKKFLSKIYENN